MLNSRTITIYVLVMLSCLLHRQALLSVIKKEQSKGAEHLRMTIKVFCALFTLTQFLIARDIACFVNYRFPFMPFSMFILDDLRHAIMAFIVADVFIKCKTITLSRAICLNIYALTVALSYNIGIL